MRGDEEAMRSLVRERVVALNQEKDKESKPTQRAEEERKKSGKALQEAAICTTMLQMRMYSHGLA